MNWLGIGLSAGVITLLVLGTRSSAASTPPGPPPEPGPSPEPGPLRFVYPVGTVVPIQTVQGMQQVKIIKNEPGPDGDYQVINASCLAPDALCPSRWIKHSEITGG